MNEMERCNNKIKERGPEGKPNNYSPQGSCKIFCRPVNNVETRQAHLESPGKLKGKRLLIAGLHLICDKLKVISHF
jgi:hypothetical protein